MSIQERSLGRVRVVQDEDLVVIWGLNDLMLASLYPISQISYVQMTLDPAGDIRPHGDCYTLLGNHMGLHYYYYGYCN